MQMRFSSGPMQWSPPSPTRTARLWKPHAKRTASCPTADCCARWGTRRPVLDGRESAEEQERLAEDVLLHEGYGPCRVAVIWAPRDLDPDPYLEAFAHFRGVFPTHTTTPGRLKMQQAFLDATGTPNAYGDGLEFLMSKGVPEVQPPGHVRWSEYESLSDVAAWLDAHNPDVWHLAAGTSVRRHLTTTPPATRLGEAHRPGLDRQPGGHDTVAFLEGLGSPVT